jgi:sugar phosphate isomerase/epimerase
MLLQHMDYLEFIRIYHERIKAFHVKDAEFHADGRSGVYGGYQNWIDRAGRFRSLGDGQIDFKRIFSLFTQYNYDGWAVLEWECCIKNANDGAREGATFIRDHMIRKAERAFDDFASLGGDAALNRRVLGLP